MADVDHLGIHQPFERRQKKNPFADRCQEKVDREITTTLRALQHISGPKF
jgi:hypothetical protein